MRGSHCFSLHPGLRYPELVAGDTGPVHHVYQSSSHQRSQGLGDGPGRDSTKQKGLKVQYQGMLKAVTDLP